MGAKYAKGILIDCKVEIMIKLEVKEGFLTTRELADLQRVSEMTVHRMVDRGALPCYQIGRGKRFRWEDVENFLERSKFVGREKKTPMERGLFNGYEEENR